MCAEPRAQAYVSRRCFTDRSNTDRSKGDIPGGTAMRCWMPQKSLPLLGLRAPMVSPRRHCETISVPRGTSLTLPILPCSLWQSRRTLSPDVPRGTSLPIHSAQSEFPCRSRIAPRPTKTQRNPSPGHPKMAPPAPLFHCPHFFANHPVTWVRMAYPSCSLCLSGIRHLRSPAHSTDPPLFCTAGLHCGLATAAFTLSESWGKSSRWPIRRAG